MDGLSQKLNARFDEMRRAAVDAPPASIDERHDRLDRLAAALEARAEDLVAEMSADFTFRSPDECRNFDIATVHSAIKDAKRNLKRWMAPRRVAMPLAFRPARAALHPQPLGVVGIIAPWNFPVYLALAPLVAALAAGNRAMIKPSEASPRTSDCLRDMITDAFAPDEVCVVTGGVEVSAAFSALPFDHLLFTGSTSVGRKVAQAAANNLTPVTLELGGKSPAVVMPSADFDRAARRIAWGRSANAGQICVAPDYALVPRKKMESFADGVIGWWMKFYPEGAESADLTAMAQAPAAARIDAMVGEARARGCQVLTAHDTLAKEQKRAPVVVLDPPMDIAVMQEEIFGPILPVVPYDSVEEALAFVAARDHPLALYVFAEERDEQEIWRDRSLSGSMAINDTVVHVGVDTLPFGGVGASGQGAYHGRAGFDRFSHLKPVFRQSKWNAMAITEPPFKGLKRRLIKASERFR
ncbi:aldehyde dehydrogenase family protein [Celeribacter sp.]|uniref:aldehyde dehydrogenase family protein n=1 Tax=Celeribacter sp. TaxID=1890673 RepID=UPI003A95DCED